MGSFELVDINISTIGKHFFENDLENSKEIVIVIQIKININLDNYKLHVNIPLAQVNFTI